MHPAKARRRKVHRSLFAIGGRAIIGLAPRLAECMQTAPNPSPGVQLPKCSHTREIYAVTGGSVVWTTVCDPICEERVTEPRLRVEATPVLVRADCPSGRAKGPRDRGFRRRTLQEGPGQTVRGGPWGATVSVDPVHRGPISVDLRGEKSPAPGRCTIRLPQFGVKAPPLTVARVAALWQPDRVAGSPSHGTCSASTRRPTPMGEKVRSW
jgi:hypothetical protein